MSVNTYHIPPRTRQLIVDNYKSGNWTKNELSVMFDASITSINTYIKRDEETGTILTEFELKKQELIKKGKKPERRKIFDNQIQAQFALDLVDLDPTASLLKHVDQFYAHFQIHIGKDTINRLFAKHKITWKKISKIAIEADDEEHALFWKCYQAIVSDPEQVLFLDESYRNDKTANPTYGRGQGYVLQYIFY